MLMRVSDEWRELLREECTECGGALLMRTRDRFGVRELDVSFPHSAKHCKACWDAYEMVWAEIAARGVVDG